MRDGFICDTCGFTSSEEIGTGNTYYCPKCGNKMRRATHGGMFGGGDANTSSSIIAWDLAYLVLVGSLSFGVINYISYWTSDLLDIILFVLWIILFIISFIFFHRTISRGVSDKAVKNNNTGVYCSQCGEKLTGNQNFCSNCGNRIR